jgi:adenylate cyclase
MSVDDLQLRYGFNSLLREEADAVLKQPVFRRSPVLSKLLRYLVEETANGRADRLKSFVVATEGLGRSQDFDAASDSSARVQMVRLRKTLESHYAQHGPLNELCVYLQPGSYTVRLGKLAVAYPMLYRPLSDTQNQIAQSSDAVNELSHSAPETLGESSTTKTDAEPNRWFKRPEVSFALMVVAAAMVVMATSVSWRFFSSVPSTPVSPVLEVLPIEVTGNDALARSSRIISNAFANDLPRFKMSRVRVLSAGESSPLPHGGETVYRLSSQVEEDAKGGQRLLVRLNDAETDVTLWSHELRFDADPQAVSDALLPLMSEINGPFGVIAANESILHRDNDSAGYSCFLKYLSFVQTRNVELEEQIGKCFSKPVKEKRIQATLLAVNAMFTVERSSAMNNFGAASKTAIDLARQAVAADPTDPLSNFAMARLSYLQNDCVSSRYYTRRAIETNSISPLMLSNLAALAPACNYPDAADILDQAFLVQSDRYPRGRLLLVLAALQQERPEMLAKIRPAEVPQSQYSRLNYYLTETLIAGVAGNRVEAVANWQKFVAEHPPGNRNVDDMLTPIIVNPSLRNKLVKLLQTRGIS